MKKVKVLLSAVAVVAIVAASFAVKARAGHVIYLPNPNNTQICDQPQSFRSFTVVPTGTQKAATKLGDPCTLGTIQVLDPSQD